MLWYSNDWEPPSSNDILQPYEVFVRRLGLQADLQPSNHLISLLQFIWTRFTIKTQVNFCLIMIGFDFNPTLLFLFAGKTACLTKGFQDTLILVKVGNLFSYRKTRGFDDVKAICWMYRSHNDSLWSLVLSSLAADASCYCYYELCRLLLCIICIQNYADIHT